mmetsp:Transcript_41573/g.137767  ORF Transcript_41573/g.137767 Transcript_41573/m.137767 type:complete len:228 (+) Transcript_41573:321-1004(+)
MWPRSPRASAACTTGNQLPTPNARGWSSFCSAMLGRSTPHSGEASRSGSTARKGSTAAQAACSPTSSSTPTPRGTRRAARSRRHGRERAGGTTLSGSSLSNSPTGQRRTCCSPTTARSTSVTAGMTRATTTAAKLRRSGLTLQVRRGSTDPTFSTNERLRLGRARGSSVLGVAHATVCARCPGMGERRDADGLLYQVSPCRGDKTLGLAHTCSRRDKTRVATRAGGT